MNQQGKGSNQNFHMAMVVLKGDSRSPPLPKMCFYSRLPEHKRVNKKGKKKKKESKGKKILKILSPCNFFL